jgi:hypothetical protein
MLKPCTAQEIQPLVFVLLFFMVLSLVASAELVVNPDGSDVNIGDQQSAHGAAVSQASITVDFNDLAPEQVVSPNRHIPPNFVVKPRRRHGSS